MYKVYFKNVGRNNASWCAECDELNYDWLCSQVKPHVMSRDLDFELTDGETVGKIYAGFHNIGTFEIDWEQENTL